MSYLSKEEEEKAREEYEQLKPFLKKEFKFKGHWEDKVKKTKFNRNLVIKGDKSLYLKYYFENQKILNDALNISIEKLNEDDII